MTFSKDIGNISQDTYVGVNFAHAWTVCILERYHRYTELEIHEVDKFIELLKEAKSVLIKEKERYISTKK